ncbi:hypothetical protein B4102_3603 [Heyndrickxia sporothermodurans]|uniref:Uncharacterized protein n=1 Tax=Heyndrickxia sporothermodurans TaxID=46224 RepID=A0A150KMZ4_9BACI|nr:hypothetical protein [Heyndrickxia sporothermodurans]KYC94382.1 hypothetical protein B4102_3603 [Heyndrickxia sporothermodurans]
MNIIQAREVIKNNYPPENYSMLRETLNWLLEQAEKAQQYKNALEEISDILDGQNVTPLVENIAYTLGHSGIYDKE